MVTEIGCPLHEREMKVWTGLGGGNSGIIGNSLHVYGFHRGASYVKATDYSRTHDPKGADGPYPNWGWCCAGDYHHGFAPTLMARHAVLLTRLMDDDPVLADICEMITKPWADKPVLYWARWDGVRNLKIYTGQGHDTWSHISVYRSRGNSSAQLWTPASAAVSPSGKPASGRSATLTPPPWPKGATWFTARPDAPAYATVRSWEARMRQRGWPVTVNGRFQPHDGDLLGAFQKEKGLKPDRLLGPKSFAAAWSLPVT